MKRINLTQHEALPDQGCEPRTEELTQRVKKLLAFEVLPHIEEIMRRAHTLAEIARFAQADEAMIGGAAYLMLFLDPLLRIHNIEPVYAFSKREVLEEVQTDENVLKVSVSHHIGFVRLGSYAGQETTYSLDGANRETKSASKPTEKK